MPRGGNTTARGYGAAHRKVREQMARDVNAGDAHCCRCGEWIDPGEPWDAGHTDDRTAYQGPEHRLCNRRAAAIKGNQARGRAKHQGTRSDAW